MKFEYVLIRSARKSVSIAISNENKVTVRCPLNFSDKKVEKFLNDKAEWIEKILSKNELELAKNNDILNFTKIFVCGEKYGLCLNSSSNEISGGEVRVNGIKNLKNLYIKCFFNGLLQQIKNISAEFGLVPKGASVKNYKSRWGSCNGKNEICFNFKIFMLPKRLQNYIVVHELCHVKQHNHSPAFWRLVENILPDYKKLLKELKNYGFITPLY